MFYTDRDIHHNYSDKAVMMPKMAMVVYGSGNRLALSAHPVTLKGKASRPVIGAGKLLDQQSRDELVALLQNQSPERKLIDKRLLATGSDFMVWYEPSAVNRMLFRVGKRVIRLKVSWPSLIYKVDGDSLSVVAYKGKSRPTTKTRLFYAPLMNVYASSKVCTGSVTLPESDDLNDWVNVMVNSYFTHTNHDHTLHSTKKTVTTKMLLKFWQTQANNPKKSFDTMVLVPFGQNLGEWINV